MIIFFFNDTTTTKIYTLSLHDALPIYGNRTDEGHIGDRPFTVSERRVRGIRRSEEHTSELQSRRDLVCRLLLEKKNDRIVSWFSCCLRLASCILPGVIGLDRESTRLCS